MQWKADLEKLEKFLRGEACLFNDGGQSPSLEVCVMHRDSDAQLWFFRMPKDVM